MGEDVDVEVGVRVGVGVEVRIGVEVEPGVGVSSGVKAILRQRVWLETTMADSVAG